jgi:trans-aconitate methyltransferase
MAAITESVTPPHESRAAHVFDGFLEAAEEPRDMSSPWHEKRRRDILMASLPLRRLGRVLEIGCAGGLVTAELSQRADTVTAIDSEVAAVQSARRFVPGDDVRFAVGRMPEDWPSGRFDTVVLSEVGCGLSPAGLDRVIELIEASTEGFLVACHSRRYVPEHTQTGDAVHRALRAMPGWETTVAHEERDFVLEVFERTSAGSAPMREAWA